MTNDPARILLIEDNSSDIYLFREALHVAGLIFELTVIEDGEAAMAFVYGKGEYTDHPVPDIAIIDLNLPRIDGIQVLEAIRAAERFVDMPVVVATSSEMPSDRLKAEQLQVARYFTKSAHLAEFLQIGVAIKEILLGEPGSATSK